MEDDRAKRDNAATPLPAEDDVDRAPDVERHSGDDEASASEDGLDVGEISGSDAVGGEDIEATRSRAS